MHRIDNSKYLLFIEPAKKFKSETPTNDYIVGMMEYALSQAKSGVSHYSSIEDDGYFQEKNAYRGMHLTDCGEGSTNCDYLLETGHITNSLAPFYLKYYRNFISDTDMQKVMQVVDYYKGKLLDGTVS